LIKGLFNSSDKTSKTFSTHILISMIPAAIVGLFFEKQVSELFNGKIMFVACMIFTNGLILMLGHYRTLATGSNSNWKSLMMGISQAVAILPGISRSGSTIATASLTNFERNEAISFSFLMVVPLILGKIAKDIMEGGMMVSSYSLSAVLLGFVTAFVTGVLACGWMLTLVRNTKMNYFAWYCIVLGAGLIIYLLLNR
jgi:undecaprenyl-diphosphatase